MYSCSEEEMHGFNCNGKREKKEKDSVSGSGSDLSVCRVSMKKEGKNGKQTIR
jgi:hypothetical protein